MAYWLLKSDPKNYSWYNLLKDKETTWDGVRNFQARIFISEMKPGDKAFFYHSQEGKDVVGIAKITTAPFHDPTSDEERWLAVKIVPFKTLKKSVSLEQIKSEPKLENIYLIKMGRLSVMPLNEDEFNTILDLSK